MNETQEKTTDEQMDQTTSMWKKVDNIVSSCDAVLYDIETIGEDGETIYRITIVGEGQTTLEKCTQISRLLSPMLDVYPPIKSEYRLEVSSPGLERKLKTMGHFKLSIGELVQVILLDKTIIKGKLKSVAENSIIVEDAEDITINLQDISRAKTYCEWE